MTPARQQLIAMIDSVVTDWKAGKDWRGGDSLHRQDFDPEELVIDPTDLDARSLRATQEFLIYFVHEMNHGDRNFDGLTWDEAVTALEETGERLRAGLPIEDQCVLRYVDTRTPEAIARDKKMAQRNWLGIASGIGSVALAIAAMKQRSGVEIGGCAFFGSLAFWCFWTVDALRNKNL